MPRGMPKPGGKCSDDLATVAADPSNGKEDTDVIIISEPRK